MTDPSSSTQADAGRYAPTAITLHWLMAVLVAIVGILGLLHDSWPRQTQTYWINLHAVIGLVLFGLLLVRIWWRRTHAPPPLPASIGKLSHSLSHIVHMLLYALLIVIPALGVVTFIWHGRVFDFGLFQIDPGVKRDKTIFHPTEDIHGYLAYALFGLVGLHALAALWHHIVKRDGVLRRMAPSAGE